MRHLLSLGMVLACASVGAAPLTLDRAYTLALDRSETLKIGDAELRAAEARYRQAAGGFWPELRAEAGADLRDEASGERETEEYRAGLGATWTIFQGFRTLRSVAARKADGESLVFTQARDRELLYEDVADVLFQTIALRKEAAVLDEAIRALDERVAELERRVALGRSRRGDLLSAQAQAADYRIVAAQVRGLHDAAREMLAFLTGLPAAELNPADESPLPSSDTVARILGARGVRADIAAAEKSAEAARLDAKAEAGARNVTVSADGNLYVWRDPERDGDWDLAIRAELPLFDRGIRRADTAEKVAQADARDLRLAELRRVADRDTRMAVREFESLLEQWASLQDALRVAAENVDLQRADYDIGRANNLDVIAALIQQYGLQRRDAALSMQVRAALVRVQVAAGGDAR